MDRNYRPWIIALALLGMLASGATLAAAVATQPAAKSASTKSPAKPKPDKRLEIEDANMPTTAMPVVVALVKEADSNFKHGNFSATVMTLERAMRIDSRNPTLTYKLARVRLKQAKLQHAEQLAKKAALLASTDREIKQKSNALIARSRQLQKIYEAAAHKANPEKPKKLALATH